MSNIVTYIKNSFSKIRAPQRQTAFFCFMILFVVTIGLFLVVRPVHAGLLEVALGNLSEIVSDLLLGIASLIGKLLVVVINILIGIAQYNDFINADAVTIGWSVIRDLCNMFFVIVLLVIAFGTILRLEQYKFNRLLARLVVMAVLINFSKLFAGFFIDLAQVVMLTFVNAFADTAAGNFTSVLKLKDMLAFSGEMQGATPPSNWELVGMPLLAIILLIIALMTILALVVVLIVRIIAIWILVVLSPLAYLLYILPGKASSYASQWWSTFFKWLTTGPIMAFFIWLALTILTSPKIAELGQANPDPSQVLQSSGSPITATISAVSSSENLLGFMLAIAMFLIALSVGSSLGGIAGAFAGKMSGKISQAGSKALQMGMRAPLGAYDWAGRKIKSGKIPFGIGKYTAGLEIRPWKIKESIQAGMKTKKEKEERFGISASGAIMKKRGGLRGAVYGLGGPDFAEQYMHGFLWNKGVRRLFAYKPQKLEQLAAEEKRKTEERDRYLGLQSEKSPEEFFKDYWGGKKKAAQEQVEVLQQEIERPKELQNQITISEDNLKKHEAAGKWDEVTKTKGLIKDYEEQLAEINRQNTEEGREVDLRSRKVIEENNLKQAEQQLEVFNRASTQSQANMAKNLLGKKLAGDIDKQIQDIRNGKQSSEQRMQTDLELKQIDRDIRHLDEDIMKKSRLGQDISADVRVRNAKIAEKQEKQKYEADEKTQKKNIEELLPKLEAQRDNYLRQATSPLSVADKLGMKDKIKAKEKEIEDIKKEQMKINAWAPQDYYSQAASRSAIAEEARKITTSNEDELNALFEGALKNDDQFLAAAITRRAAQVGHLNELLNFRPEKYTANQEGLSNFISKYFMDRLKFAEQQALNLQNDLSEEAQNVNHWTFAQSVGVKNGLYYQRSPDEQSLRSFVEMSKRDPEGLIRGGNRLMYGGERADGTFELGGPGLMLIRKSYDNMTEQMLKQRFNKNAAMKLVTDGSMAKLKRLMQEDPEINKVKFQRFLDTLQDFAAGSMDKLQSEADIVNRVAKGY